MPNLPNSLKKHVTFGVNFVKRERDVKITHLIIIWSDDWCFTEKLKHSVIYVKANANKNETKADVWQIFFYISIK